MVETHVSNSSLRRVLNGRNKNGTYTLPILKTVKYYANELRELIVREVSNTKKDRKKKLKLVIVNRQPKIFYN